MLDKTSEMTRADLPAWHRLSANWGWLLALGIVWMVVGVLAIIVPFAATLAINLVLGAVLAAGGITQLIESWRCRGSGGTLALALGGLLALVLGGLLLFFPLEGIATLTLFLSAFFIAQGALKVVAAFQNRGLRHWGWLLLSGILGIAIGVLIWLGWPSSSAWALGLLAGIELTFGGLSMILLAIAARASGVSLRHA